MFRRPLYLSTFSYKSLAKIYTSLYSSFSYLISSLLSWVARGVNKVSQRLEKWERKPKLHRADNSLQQRDRFLMELHVTETFIAPVITACQPQTNENVIRWAALPLCPQCFYAAH